SELISIVSSLWSTVLCRFLARFIGPPTEVRRKTAKKRHNTGRPEATDDGDKLRNCSIEEKRYEGSTNEIAGKEGLGLVSLS
ncbi:hypothetical protein L9F63_026008, partial [Diploptera punctata]